MKLPLSILILAKNEQNTIEYSISSLRTLASEILVYDTGSTDHTRKIALTLGAKLIYGNLGGDFSKARNAMLDLARFPWILQLDADSRIAVKDVSNLAPLLKKDRWAYSFPRRNYTNALQSIKLWCPCRNEYPSEEKFSGAYGYYESEQVFLFRKDRRIRYRFPIHETVRPSLEENGLPIKKAGIVIHHFEFLKGMPHHLKKHRFYLGLERKTVRQYPQYPVNRFNLLADILLTGGSPRRIEKDARLLCRKWSGKADYHALLGIILLLQGRGKEAQRCFKKALLHGGAPEHFCLAGWGWLRDGDLLLAKKYLLHSLSKAPANPLALNLLGNVYCRMNKPRRALTLFNRALKWLPCYEEALYNKNLVRKALIHKK